MHSITKTKFLVKCTNPVTNQFKNWKEQTEKKILLFSGQSSSFEAEFIDKDREIIL